MTVQRREIVVAGGGMVGLSLALALDSLLGDRFSVVLVEGYPLPRPDAGFAASYSPSFDARTTALSYSSRLIYEELGIWEQLAPRCCAIDSIHVSDRGRFGSTLLSAADHDWPALGYVIENAWLGNILARCFHERGSLEAWSPLRVESAASGDGGVQLALSDGGTVQAQLLVVADGAGSGLRERLGVAASSRPYDQQALIANIGHARPHDGRAFERFTEQGPLAMLPLLPDSDGGQRSALVWSLPPGRAQALCEADGAEFLAALQERFGYRLGRLQRVGERVTYPLALVEAREQVRSHVVIMGNAAHTLHPVAGQGFNLALRDVLCLAHTLAELPGVGAGDLEVLQRYRQRQAEDQRFTTGFSDHLPALFMHRDPLVGILRDLGLMALDGSAALKREFTARTAGIAALDHTRSIRQDRG